MNQKKITITTNIIIITISRRYLQLFHVLESLKNNKVGIKSGGVPPFCL